MLEHSKLLISIWLNNVRTQIGNKNLPYLAIGQQKKETWNFLSFTDQLVVNHSLNRVFLVLVSSSINLQSYQDPAAENHAMNSHSNCK